MATPGSRRILAAVLFTDIVDSTAVAEELGDRRWKTLVDRHHRLVRQGLKRYGGRELDTAGDGFFASFKEPASAIGCASSLVEAVRDLGIEIRTGVHFGECEQIGKKLGGITVVVAARIMALGGAGDVLVSGTAAELARGAGFGTADRGTHVLKGVEGEWRVVAVEAVDRIPLPAPLDPATAAERRAQIAPEDRLARSRLPIAIAAVAAAVVLAVAAFVAFSGGEGPMVPGPDTVARIDPANGTFDQVVSVGADAFPDGLATNEGKIWVANVAGRTLMQIDAASGESQTFGTPSVPTGVAAADGRIWVTYGFNADPQRRVDVLDPGDPVLQSAGIDVPDASYPITAGAGALWIADPLGSTVVRFDPVTGSTESVELPLGSGPIALAFDDAGSHLWIAAGREASVFRLDAGALDAPLERFGTGGNVPAALSVSSDGTVWIAELDADAVLALSPTGTTLVDAPLGDRCDGPNALVATEAAVWVSCSLSSNLVRVDPRDGSIAASLDVGGEPGPMALDATGAPWVGVRGS